MVGDSQAPATKEDVKGIMEYLVKNEEKIHNLAQEMKESEKRMKRHFDVVAENITHDFLHGALHDKIEQHEDRIQTLEQHTSLVVA